MPTYLTVRDLASRWGVSLSVVYQIVAAGQLPALRIGTGRGTIRVRAADVEAYEDYRRGPDAAEIDEHLG